MVTAEIDSLSGRVYFARLLHLLTGKKLCGWGGCDRLAVCGGSCRRCFEERHAQKVSLLMAQPARYLAEMAVLHEEQRDFVGAATTHLYCHARGCGHSMVVHTHAGCGGLRPTGGMDDWVPCKCQGFVR